ncbi:PH domain-containing protein [Bacillus sp. WLY-B-L8]|uniref:PH domain-containing protein n=1 Tax=Bacillus multifaciens TaxID=3068506 RepID=UPI0027414CC4|nr:PH domain-containing protein [Bacillus sp. WLY-B-L8]MDP7978953.1 PH domain-containing protein [Bacillus sp. WLY-B-L8]
MKFKVKQNPFHMLILLVTIFVFVALFFIQEDNNVYLSCMILLNIINFLFVYRSTYTITDKSLIIKYYFTDTEIPFKDIQHMKYYGKSLHSKKWTRQRLEITYGLFNTLTVCVPQEEDKFIDLLKEKCPNIKIINKPANE